MSALEIAPLYVAASDATVTDRMDALRSKDYALDSETLASTASGSGRSVIGTSGSSLGEK